MNTLSNLTRIQQEITERIRYVERFEILVSGKSYHYEKSRIERSCEYPFSRAANRQMPVSKWLETRFRSTYQGFKATVVYPNGLAVASDIPIGVVRDTYIDTDHLYGQSMSFEFYSYNKSSIINLQNQLNKAGIRTIYSNPSILFLWEWFRIEGNISRIHLPLFYRLALPNILKSFIGLQDINFKSQFNSESCHLFEADSNYSYFGMEELNLLKSFSE